MRFIRNAWGQVAPLRSRFALAQGTEAEFRVVLTSAENGERQPSSTPLPLPAAGSAAPSEPVVSAAVASAACGASLQGAGAAEPPSGLTPAVAKGDCHGAAVPTSTEGGPEAAARDNRHMVRSAIRARVYDGDGTYHSATGLQHVCNKDDHDLHTYLT